jgi:hypothetical protein
MITENKLSALELMNHFSAEIKQVVADKYQILPQDLFLMKNNKNGAYFSKIEENVFCCFAVGKNGYLYLVKAEIEVNNNRLVNYVCGIVS